MVVDAKIAGGGNVSTGKLSGSFVVTGSTITRLGADDTPTPKDAGTLAGSTYDLNISGLNIQVRASLAVATSTKLGIVVQCAERAD